MILYNNNYYANYTNTTSNSSIFAGIGLVYLILSLTVTLLMIISMWKIFKKAGRNGWEAIIPVYGQIVICQVVGVNPWWLLVVFIGGFVLNHQPINLKRFLSGLRYILEYHLLLRVK